MTLMKLFCRCGEPLLLLGRGAGADCALRVYSPHNIGIPVTRCPSCGADLVAQPSAPLAVPAPEDTPTSPRLD